jgi:tetrahydromethanopterin S-methyltransferase subunit D
MGELNPWGDTEWVVAIVERDALVKNGIVVTGSPHVHLIPVTGHRSEEIKTAGIGIGDLAMSAGPAMSFGAFKLDTLLAFALRNGFFGPEPEDQA